MALVLDTGPLLALFDRRDDYHESCAQLIRASAEPLVIPMPVLSELDYFIEARLNPQVRLALLDDINAGGFQVEPLVATDFGRVRELCGQYADADIGFVDAAVLAIVERLNEPKLATLDRRHFETLRPLHVESLSLLP